MPAPYPDVNRRHRLSEALQISRKLAQSKADGVDTSVQQRWRERLRLLQAELKSFAHPIQKSQLSVQTIPHSVRRAFVQAVAMLTRYSHSGGLNWHGTLDSPTLSKYRTDIVPPQWHHPQAIAQLCIDFELTDEDHHEIVQLLQRADAGVNEQRSLIRHILEDSGAAVVHEPSANSLRTLREDTREVLVELFHALFGAVSLPAAAIDGVYTDTQIYFCIDYTGDRLTDETLWHQLTAFEQTTLQSFLQSLGQFHFDSFRRFPTFGACRPAEINSEWCDRLAQDLQMDSATVRRILSRAVGIVPTAKAESFLLHDIWGHNWQLMLTPFESDYESLADCDDPLRAGETAYTVDGPLTCGELFTLHDSQVLVDEQKARLFFRGEARQRLGLLFTHLIGELVADVAEFKFVWDYPQSAHELISSSLFKDEPTKLDLGLADVDFLFMRVLKPLLEVTLSVSHDSRLELDLLHQWQTLDAETHSLELRASLKQAIANLYSIFLDEYRQFYLPTCDGEVGLFTQIVSNLLYLQNVVNELYTMFSDTENLPFQDLLMLLISSFCSSDSYAEFWDVDDAIAAYFLPCWHLLKETSTSLKLEPDYSEVS